MRLAGLIALTMMAFAANSVLNRLALAQTDLSAVDFALYRVLFGALTLFAVLAIQGQLREGRFSWPSALGLLSYMLGFSLAYQSLGAGIGALILFGTVQLTMFAGAALGKERPSPAAIQGAVLGLIGLAVVLWPRGDLGAVPLGAAGFMIVAGLGWGVFSLAGRSASAPLATTFRAFLACLPVMLLVALAQGIAPPDPLGLGYAALSGAVMSGLGYTLWYRLLPQIATTSAALAQLTVPLLAMLGGVVLLGEGVGLALVIGTALVLGGVFWPLWRRRQHASS